MAQVGAGNVVGVIEQVNATVSLNSPNAITSTVAVDEPPGVTVAGESADVDTAKVGFTTPGHWILEIST